MYKSFFNLERYPFEISPDPYFLYATGPHQEALAGLSYGITARKGFMVLTGEVGTGKTLVVRCLLDYLDKERISYAYIFNSRLSSRQFLQYVLGDLGLPNSSTSKSELLIQLSRHLIERHRQGLITVLIVDEAQHLTPVVLEEIRMLTNLETPAGKLLQIALIGQPELRIELESPALRQLKQRVALWFQLGLFSEAETFGYVQYRLKMAGNREGQIFTRPALERIHRYSQGIPRLINTLCDNAMISAFALGQECVSPELIDEAASDLILKRVNGNNHSAVTPVPGDEDYRGRLESAKSVALPPDQRDSEPAIHSSMSEDTK